MIRTTGGWQRWYCVIAVGKFFNKKPTNEEISFDDYVSSASFHQHVMYPYPEDSWLSPVYPPAEPASEVASMTEALNDVTELLGVLLGREAHLYSCNWSSEYNSGMKLELTVQIGGPR